MELFVTNTNQQLLKQKGMQKEPKPQDARGDNTGNYDRLECSTVDHVAAGRSQKLKFLFNTTGHAQ